MAWYTNRVLYPWAVGDADPHPGNIAVSASGDLIFYDFGMMCETSRSRDRLMDVFFGIYQKDADKASAAQGLDCWYL